MTPLSTLLTPPPTRNRAPLPTTGRAGRNLPAAIGVAAALVGLAPRLIGMSWAVIAWSGFAQFFGGLVELKDWAKDLSVLGHHLDVVGSPDWKPLAVQTAVGIVGVAIGVVAYTRRDLPS